MSPILEPAGRRRKPCFSWGLLAVLLGRWEALLPLVVLG